LRRFAGALAATALLALAGCATTGGDERDPWEPFNRSMYEFNDTVDRAVLKPVASAYRDYAPDPLRNGIRNFFGNLADLFIGVNNLLQGKVQEGLSDWGRFGINTVVGFFGLADVASDIGLEKHNEDFGQTFGRWGSASGPYLVWPFLGPSTARDSVGQVLDLYFDPVRSAGDAAWPLALTRVTSVRADLLDASRLLEEAALDRYVFQRDAFLQRRRSLVYDGQPPRERIPE
jgi:phospholipid-binding lipoprotein MlaA